MSSTLPPDASFQEQYISSETSPELSSNQVKSISDITYLNGALSEDTHLSPKGGTNCNKKLIFSSISKEMSETDINPNSLASSQKDEDSIKSNGSTTYDNNLDCGERINSVISDATKSESLLVSMKPEIKSENFCSNDCPVPVINELESTVNNYNFQTDKSANFETKLQCVSIGDSLNENNDCDANIEDEEEMENEDSTNDCDNQMNNLNNNEDGNNDCGNESNSDSCDILDDRLYRVPRSPIFNGSYDKKIRGSLKRKAEDSGKDNEDAKKKRAIKFDNVTVFYFPRSQGFNCVPSQGGSTLGMSRKHFSIKSFSLQEYAAEQRKAHRNLLLKLKQQRSKKININHCSSSEDSEENTEEASDISDSELEADSFYFLQPLPIRRRRAMLRQSGIQQIEGLEKDECKSIRNSRELCGCQCKTYCDPSTCQCSLAGIKCQVDRHNFPCGCSRDCCKNENGRIEFNPIRVRTHFLHTLMRLELEKCQSQWEQQQGLSSPSTNNSTSPSLVHNCAGLSWFQAPASQIGCSSFESPPAHSAVVNDLSAFYNQNSTIQSNNLSQSSLEVHQPSSSALYQYDSRSGQDCSGTPNNSIILSQGNVSNNFSGHNGNSLFSDSIFPAFESCATSFIPYPTPTASNHSISSFPAHMSGFASPFQHHASQKLNSGTCNARDSFNSNSFPFASSPTCSSSLPSSSVVASCMSSFDRFSSVQNVYPTPHQSFTTASSSCLASSSNDTLCSRKLNSFSLSDVLGDLGSEASCDATPTVNISVSGEQRTVMPSQSPLHADVVIGSSSSSDCMMSGVNLDFHGSNQANTHISRFPFNSTSGPLDVLSDFDSLTNALLKPCSNKSISSVCPDSNISFNSLQKTQNDGQALGELNLGNSSCGTYVMVPDFTTPSNVTDDLAGSCVEQAKSKIITADSSIEIQKDSSNVGKTNAATEKIEPREMDSIKPLQESLSNKEATGNETLKPIENSNEDFQSSITSVCDSFISPCPTLDDCKVESDTCIATPSLSDRRSAASDEQLEENNQPSSKIAVNFESKTSNSSSSSINIVASVKSAPDKGDFSIKEKNKCQSEVNKTKSSNNLLSDSQIDLDGENMNNKTTLDKDDSVVNKNDSRDNCLPSVEMDLSKCAKNLDTEFSSKSSNVILSNAPENVKSHELVQTRNAVVCNNSNEECSDGKLVN